MDLRRTFFFIKSAGRRGNGENMEKRNVELLAPAGSFASMKAAVAAGADAVYMGGPRFGARAYADNPDELGMLEAIDYVHLHGRRLYMTVNTLFKEEELGALYGYLLPYYKRGLDGVIVQDLGALRLIREAFPGLELHASTQMTITSAYSAKRMKQLGCCRVVPARELSLEEIRHIYEETGLEIECFVHGALCYCYSGQCLMSSLIGGRSGNRGRCAQPCRLPYSTDHGGSREQFLLNLKDLCTLDILPQILQAGVYSMKIEGRMKSPRYTAGVVSIYRKYVDLYLKYGEEGYYVEPEDKKALLDLFDRGGFTEGYYGQHNGKDMVALGAKPGFREGNQALFDHLDKNFVEKEVKEEICGAAQFKEGESSAFTLTHGDVSVTVYGQAPQAAQNQPMSREKAEKQLNKTGNTPFCFKELSADIEGALFMPVQALNELRRMGLEALNQAILGQWSRNEAGEPQNLENQPASGEVLPESGFPAFTASVQNESQLEPLLSCKETGAIYLDSTGFEPDTWQAMAERCHKAGKQCFLILPHIFRTHAIKVFAGAKRKLLEAGFDGLLVRTLEEVQWMEEEGIGLPFGLDASVYAWNHAAVRTLKETGAAFLTMPWELNSRELGPVVSACEEEKLPSQLIVYGHAPMMVSAQCITRTTGGCSHKKGLLYMKDRTGAMLPVQNHCDFCYNTILNPLPLSLLGSAGLIEKMGISSIRLQFTVENRETVEKILSAFVTSFVKGQEAEEPVKDFTRGHFKRGVE
jgi:putative protease